MHKLHFLPHGKAKKQSSCTAFDGIRAYKRREKVTFPFFLHMDQFIYSKQLYEKMSLSSCKGFSRSQGTTPVEEKRNVYSLCAVICHLGDIEAGHYITYRKCLIPGGKGQLISKCPFGVFKLTKKSTKFL